MQYSTVYPLLYIAPVDTAGQKFFLVGGNSGKECFGVQTSPNSQSNLDFLVGQLAS